MPLKTCQRRGWAICGVVAAVGRRRDHEACGLRLRRAALADCRGVVYPNQTHELIVHDYMSLKSVYAYCNSVTGDAHKHCVHRILASKHPHHYAHLQP